MHLAQWAARWSPLESYQPCRVWVPKDDQTVSAAPPDDPVLAPRDLTLILSPAEADDLPRHLTRIVEQAGPARDDRITVDLGTAAQVHLTGLHLLLAVLWRRVGPQGSVDLAGGSSSLRDRMDSLAVTPQHVRRDVFGTPLLAPPQRRELTAITPLIPQQRQGRSVRVELCGELDISNAARHRTRLEEVLASGAREVEVDLAGVTFMDLTTLRILLQADAQLRARGGRLRLLNPSRLVRRLLAITATEHLAPREPQRSLTSA